MFRTCLLLCVYISPFVRVQGFGKLNLEIYNNLGEPIKTAYIAKNVSDTLILVCKTKLEDVHDSTLKLTWILPNNKNRANNAAPRPHKILEEDDYSVRLMVENLQESDHGQYRCINKNGNKDDPATAVNLFIRRSIDCGKGVFCDDHCIHERFKCDGKDDCKNGKDEYMCGPDPCRDKFRCESGRCIPQSWCCNSNNENCTKKWDIMCCPNNDRGPVQHDYKAIADPFHGADRRYRGEFGDHPVNYLNNPHQYTDLNFLQTTIYAVFGCAILFMLIVTILVVVMQCKLQMRRNWQFQLLNRQRSFGNTYQRTLNQEDLMDMVVERYNQGNSHSRELQQQPRNAGGLLVTYNINNGVQIVGKPIEPPPYSEVAPSPPPDHGPPPPYIPRSGEGEGEDASSASRKPGRKERRGLSKVQASSEPTLTNLN